MSGISSLYEEVKSIAPEGTNIDAEIKKLTRDGNYTERGALNLLKDKFSIRKEGNKTIEGFWLGGTPGQQQACYWVLIPNQGVETIFVRSKNRTVPNLPRFNPIEVKTEVETNIVNQTASLTCVGPTAIKATSKKLNPATLLSSFTALTNVKNENRKQVISEGFIVGLTTPRWQSGKRLENALPLLNQDSSLNAQVIVASQPGVQQAVSVSLKVRAMESFRKIVPIKDFDIKLREKGIDWLQNQLMGEHVIFFGFCTSKIDGKEIRRPSVGLGKTGFIELYDKLYRELQSGGAVVTSEDMGHNKFTKLIRIKLKKHGEIAKSSILKLAGKCNLSKDEADDLLAQMVDGKHIKAEKGKLTYRK